MFKRILFMFRSKFVYCESRIDYLKKPVAECVVSPSNKLIIRYVLDVVCGGFVLPLGEHC